ncbi:MAG: butyrate kinase [Ruminococcaceae bacterium]|nr:butyrate kinase [Oscillospiraceae bacterium]
MKNLLIINPGSTSTKLAVWTGYEQVFFKEFKVDSAAIKHLDYMVDQLPLRLESVEEFFKESPIKLDQIDYIVSRGGSLFGLKCGAYKVSEHLVTIATNAPRSQHISSLGCVIAHHLSQQYGIPAIIYDAIASHDADDRTKLTGIPQIKRWLSSHVLNSKFVARQVAEKIGKSYDTANIIVAHLGGGITINYHSKGKIVDTVTDDEGPFSPQRSGRIPCQQLIRMCFSGKYTEKEMVKMIRGNGGLVAYLGVQDARDVEKMILEGNQLAKDLYEVMAYSVAKGIAELSVIDNGNIDAIIITGGIAHSKMFTDMIVDRVKFLAEVHIVPGEMEMQALAYGGMRVIEGKEIAQDYNWLPSNCSSLEDVRRLYGKGCTCENE